jgi:MFS family permease
VSVEDREQIEPGAVLRNPTVLGIGLASLFSDVGHEMATSAMPAFLVSLGAPASVLGAIEGIADASLSASKLAGGVLADRPRAHRKRIAAGGYLVTGLGYGSFALASTWGAVALGRAVAWTARGVRTPAREALLAGAVPQSHLGRAFGVERAADSTGAIIGPLLAAALLAATGFHTLFLLSFVPALLAAMAIMLLTKESPRERIGHLSVSLRVLAKAPGRFRTLVAGLGFYGLGNFSATLLILYATRQLADSGRSAASAATAAIILYATHNASNALFAYPAGALADRLGRKHVLAAGMGLYAAACLGFLTEPKSIPLLAVLFVAVGCSTALVETGRGSYASEILPDALRGRGFGLLGLVDGMGDLVSSVVVGLLWTIAATAWGFIWAAAFSLLGLGALVFGWGHGGGDPSFLTTEGEASDAS